MMKKNRTIYFLLALVCLGLQSCLFQEEDYFDDSSANRATADVKRCSELLEAAPNGWVMVRTTRWEVLPCFASSTASG